MKIGPFEFNLRDVSGCRAWSMAAGFVVGLALYYLVIRSDEGVPHAH